MNVKIVGISAGMSYGYLGPTHHATEDLACLRVLPNLQIFSPATAFEAKAIVKYSYETEGPMYIRLGRIFIHLLGITSILLLPMI